MTKLDRATDNIFKVCLGVGSIFLLAAVILTVVGCDRATTVHGDYNETTTQGGIGGGGNATIAGDADSSQVGTDHAIVGDPNKCSECHDNVYVKDIHFKAIGQNPTGGCSNLGCHGV